MRTVTKVFFDYLLRGSGNFQGSKNGQSFGMAAAELGCGFLVSEKLLHLSSYHMENTTGRLLLYRLSRLLKLNKLTFMTFYVLYNLQHNQKRGYILQINTQKSGDLIKIEIISFFWEPTFTLYKNGN